MKPLLSTGNLISLAVLVFVSFSYGKHADVRNSERSDVPAIFIIIDHSGSMYFENAQFKPPMDRWGIRFSIAQNLIDTVTQMYSSSEIGLSVFGSNLYFDPVDDTKLFKSVSGNTEEYYKGAFIPLLQLDSTYDYILNTGSGYEILQHYLKTDTSNFEETNKANNEYLTLEYRPTDSALAGTGTNITAAFNAAKDAFSKSRVVKENQFIFFFSDGEANYPSNNSSLMNAYIEGLDVPTTFTIFFTDEDFIPNTLDSMTENIKSNCYSASNSLSHSWPCEANNDSLYPFLISMITSVVAPSPIKHKKNEIHYQDHLELIIKGELLILNKSVKGDLAIYNLTGRKVQSIYIDKKSGSKNRIPLKKSLSPGLYFYKFRSAISEDPIFRGSFLIK